MKTKKSKPKKRTLYHVHLKNTFPYKAHFYFGSIKAIYNHTVAEKIHVSIHTLYKFDFDDTYYQNDFCFIFKSSI